MKKLRVGVLMGGKNIEKEVSFNSGRTACDHLDTVRYEIIPLFESHTGNLYILPWHFLHRGKISDFEHRLSHEATHIIWDDLPELIDFLYNAIPGRYTEDGALQGMLELLNIPYLGSSRFASAVCMDKIMVKRILAQHGIEVPRGIHYTSTDAQKITMQEIISQLESQNVTLPVVVKPHAEGSSFGITVVHKKEDLEKAVAHACFINPKKPQAVIIEEMLDGMEFSCITIEDYRKKELLAMPPTEIVIEKGSEIFDYEQKYMPGRAHKFTPPRCDDTTIKKIQDVCKKTMELLEIKTLSRIDGFATKDGRIVIVEPNTLTGMAPSSFFFREAAEIGFSHTDIINHLIETDLDRYGMLKKIELAEKKAQKKNTEPKIKVGVLLGGPSHEKEISLESGRNVVYKLSPHKYEATPIFVDQNMHLYALEQSQLVRNSTHEINSLLNQKQKITWHSLKEKFDFIFIGLHGGPGENGSVQGTLEMLGIPYNGSSVLASTICMDKYKTAQILQSAGFTVPQQIKIEKKSWHEEQKTILKSVVYPCIVKPHDDGCSVMVEKIMNEKDLFTTIEKLFGTEKSTLLIEQFVNGMELTVGVIGNNNPRALPPSQAIATGGILSIEEKFLPGAGENQTPAPLPQKALALVQKTMEEVYTTIGCKGYARIDCFYQTAKESPTGKEQVVILEINSLPGLTPATCIFHQAAEIGLKPMDFIDLIVQYGLEEHTPILEKLAPLIQPKKAKTIANPGENSLS